MVHVDTLSGAFNDMMSQNNVSSFFMPFSSNIRECTGSDATFLRCAKGKSNCIFCLTLQSLTDAIVSAACMRRKLQRFMAVSCRVCLCHMTFADFQELIHANSRRGQSVGTYQSVHKVDERPPRSRCQGEAQEGVCSVSCRLLRC